jgi:hypothetical protein
MIAAFGKCHQCGLDGSNARLKNPGDCSTIEFPHSLFKLTLGGEPVGSVGDTGILVAADFQHFMVAIKEDGRSSVGWGVDRYRIDPVPFGPYLSEYFGLFFHLNLFCG